MYENQFHLIGNSSAEILCDAADWSVDAWIDKTSEDDEAVLIPDYPNESRIPSPEFEFISSE